MLRKTVKPDFIVKAELEKYIYRSATNVLAKLIKTNLDNENINNELV